MRYYEKQSPTIQTVQNHRTMMCKFSEVLMATSLKWLTKKCIWFKQWPLALEKKSGFRMAGTGGTRGSAYGTINQHLQLSSICCLKEVEKMNNGYRSKRS